MELTQSSTVEAVYRAVTETFEALDALFELDADELNFRPDLPEAWTFAEHLEHVSLANHFLLLAIAKGCRKAVARAADAPVPEGSSDLDILAPLAEPGSFQWSVPAHMTPTGKRPLGEIREELRLQRGECLELLAVMPRGEGRLHTIWMSVHKLGRLDMYQWLYFLVQHARFHVALISSRHR